MSFTRQQMDALFAIRRVLQEEKVLVIGAAALGCSIDMNWRGTMDLDLTLAIGLSESEAILSNKLEWVRDAGVEHRWQTADGLLVDVLSITPGAIEKNESLHWPKSGRRMSLSGFRLAFATANTVSIGHGLSARVADLPAITVLKMLAYLDRPSERRRDLEDIGHILEKFVGDDAPERWDGEIIDLQIDFEEVSSFILGRKLNFLVNDQEREIVDRFLARLHDDSSDLALFATQGPLSWRKSTEFAARRLNALRRGFSVLGAGSGHIT